MLWVQSLIKSTTLLKIGIRTIRNENEGVIKLYIFPVKFEGAEELKYIFPSKQKAAQKAIELARADKRIKRLIVFGSAVTLDCGIGSDIDIAIDAPSVGQDEFLSVAHPFMREIPSEVDIVHYNNVTADLLKSEIQNKGVELYVYRG